MPPQCFYCGRSSPAPLWRGRDGRLYCSYNHEEKWRTYDYGLKHLRKEKALPLSQKVACALTLAILLVLALGVRFAHSQEIFMVGKTYQMVFLGCGSEEAIEQVVVTDHDKGLGPANDLMESLVEQKVCGPLQGTFTLKRIVKIVDIREGRTLTIVEMDAAGYQFFWATRQTVLSGQPT